MNGNSYASAPRGSLCGLDRVRKNVTFPKLSSDACQLNTSMKRHRHRSVAVPKAVAETACSWHRCGADCTCLQPERQTWRKHHCISHVILLRTSVPGHLQVYVNTLSLLFKNTQVLSAGKFCLKMLISTFPSTACMGMYAF